MTPRDTARFGTGVGLFASVLALSAVVGVFGEDILIYVALTGERFVSIELPFDVMPGLDDLVAFGWFLGVVGATLVLISVTRLVS